jgi:hypothetical protein
MQRRPLDQVNKLCAAMGVQFGEDPNLWAATLEKIAELNKAVWVGEAPTAQGIHTVLLLHALAPFPMFVDSLLAVPDLDPAYITTRLDAKQQMPKSSSFSANAATGAKTDRRKPKGGHCSNPTCKSPAGHTYPYCISPGGGMAGKSLDDACAKKRADDGSRDGG